MRRKKKKIKINIGKLEEICKKKVELLYKKDFYDIF